ncbi:MAG: hypothetical protein ACRYG7_41685 [Janthinobacterium lividum]
MPHQYVPGLVGLATLFSITTAVGQQLPALTAQDYARAERFVGYNTLPLVDRSMGAPTWLAGDRFWYRVLTPQGSEFILVDPARKTKTAAFDAAKLAAALGTASGTSFPTPSSNERMGNKVPLTPESSTKKGGPLARPF